MKWLFVLLLLVSCNHHDKEKTPTNTESNNSVNNGFDLPWETEKDSGYFKGNLPKELSSIEFNEETELFRFLSGIISKREIILLDSHTVSHSAFIDQKTATRLDTFRNSKTIITSEYRFTERPSQIIKLNGKILRNYQWDGTDSTQEDILDLIESSFRHFSFKGKEFYYVMAKVMDRQYGSIHTLCYHLLFTPSSSSFNTFLTCRFEPMLFGD